MFADSPRGVDSGGLLYQVVIHEPIFSLFEDESARGIQMCGVWLSSMPSFPSPSLGSTLRMDDTHVP